MAVGRGMVTSLVDELLAEGVIVEGETAESPRGRKPKLLRIRTDDRYVVAVDVRFTRTYLIVDPERLWGAYNAFPLISWKQKQVHGRCTCGQHYNIR